MLVTGSMRAGLRFGIFMVAAALAFAPAAAQNTTNTTNTTAADAIGPRELRDFSLNGTVTREAPVQAPRPAPPPARSAPGREGPPAAAVPAPRADIAPTRPRAQESARPAPSVTVPLPPPAAREGSELPVAPPPSFTTQPSLAPPIIPEAANVPPEQRPSLLPWLLAALLIAGGVGYYAWRQQSRAAIAGHGAALEAFVPAEPKPEPLARTPLPQPPVPAPAATIVSTRLRPQVEIELLPGRCVFDQNGARIEFEIGLSNSGGAPARDVLLEACMFNAGPAQDQEIGAFFAHPVGTGNRVPMLPPLKRLAFKSAVALTLQQMKVFEIAGRKVFVPLIAFNALYRWSGGEGQTSASYLVGRDTQAEKLAPFRVDLGPKLFRDLGAREHHVRVRK